MSSYTSTKQLWHLVTEQSVQASDDVLASELGLQRPLLRQGLSFFAAPTRSSREAFLKKRAGTPAAGAALPPPPGKLTQFIIQLSQLLRLEEEQAKQILSAYLAGDFRGTKQSLKKLIEEDRFQRPLLLDIWQFYRAERLHLLQVLKEILSHACSPEHPHRDLFRDTLEDLKQDDGMRDSLMKQMELVMTETVPSRETNGKHFNDQCVRSWVHFNLREQAELLQLNLLYLHSNGNGANYEAFTELYQLFINHGFGHRQNSSHLLADVNADLLESIGHLEALTLIYLIDLPGLTVDLAEHDLWRSAVNVSEMDRLLTSLGSCPDHGPIMLAWMLAHYVAGGEESLAKYHSLGERAIQMRSIHFLTRITSNEVVCSNATVRGISKGICYALLSVLTSAFELKRMGLSHDVLRLTQLLFRQESIATDFWKQGYSVGLGIQFLALLENFPVDLKSVCQLCTELALAGPRSADNVLACLQQMSVFAEQVDLVPSRQLLLKGPEADRFQLLVPRFPCEMTKELFIPAGTLGIADGHVLKWQTSFNGWLYLLAEIGLLNRQISSGAKNINSETVGNVVVIAKLLDALLRNSKKALGSIGLVFSQSIFSLIEKFVHMPDPPLVLLAHCVQCLSLVANEKPRLVWDRLSESGLFPYFSRSTTTLYNGDVNPGLIGALLARQECVNGEYPLTSAFLDLLLSCAKSDDATYVSDVHPTTASITYVVQDVFPSFQQWRFANPVEKEVFGQKMLCLFNVLLTAESAPKQLQSLLCQTLVQPAPVTTLLRLIGTGDRLIQSLVEAQSSWESGVGVELASLVNLAMKVFEKLLHKTDATTLESISKLLCSPSTDSQPHFLLTIAHYIYHVHNFDVPNSAMKLLATIADLFPMSLLACLGNDAEAVRDILIFRLESKTEDIPLKVAIIEFFSACVGTQPGLIQLLIGILDVSVANTSGGPLTEQEKAKNAAAKLVSDSGCLRSIVSLLKDAKEVKSKKMEALQIAVMNFVLSLWQHQRIIAIAHLKNQDSFWTYLTWSLFDKDLMEKIAINSRVFRIISSEIYTFSGKVDQGLVKVLEKLCDEKQTHFSDWCCLVMAKIRAHSAPPAMEIDETTTSAAAQEIRAETVSLLGAWKAFLMVLSRDQPVTLTPGQCHLVASQLIQAIREQLTCQNKPTTRLVTSLAELCLVLMQRWQTKCADNMEDWCKKQAHVLEDLSFAFDHLHPRARAAILGIANTALKTSQFKLNKDEAVLELWLEPSASIVQKSFFHYENCEELCDKSFNHSQVPILALGLLRNLVSRFGDPKVWFGVIHRKVLVQSLLSRIHHGLGGQKDTELVLAVLSLLVLLAKTDVGCRALLSSDLSQMIWLPLSDIKQANKEWIPVFQLSLQLVTALLRKGKHDAIEDCVTVVALLQEQLTTFLLVPKISIQTSHLELTVTTASFIGLFMGYHKEWQLHHSATLVHFYHTVCSLVHISTCLLLRPSLLGLLIDRHRSADILHRPADDEAEQRVRRMSSTDQEVEVSTPETARVQNHLLDAIGAGLGVLRTLSPDLVDLVTGNVVDHAQYDQLLGMGFSSPAFEQEGGLTYGTLISISNICIRSVTRGERSPSPAPLRQSSTSSSAAPSPQPTRIGHMDRRRLIPVLEQSLLVMLAQSLLCFSDPRCSSRDNQFLRRELGAEFSSCIESMRRYVHRGAKSPQTVLGGSGSPGGATGGNTKLAKSDEQFMKVIATIVQTVFK